MPDSKDILADVDASDGLGVTRVAIGNSRSLHFTFRTAGEYHTLPGMASEDSLEFYSKADPDPESLGEMAAERELAEAMCRYLNVGGSPGGIGNLFRQVLKYRLPPLGIPGYYLLATSLNADGEHEHLFAKQDGTAGIRWVEGRFIEHVSLVDIVNDLRQENGEGAHGDRQEEPAGQVDVLSPEGPRATGANEGAPAP
jgi:hypothetical protein